MPTVLSAPAKSEPGLAALKAFGQGTLDRLYAFRVIYVAIFVFILLLVIITQTIGASIMLVWIKDTYSIEAKTYNALSGGGESAASHSLRTSVPSSKVSSTAM